MLASLAIEPWTSVLNCVAAAVAIECTSTAKGTKKRPSEHSEGRFHVYCLLLVPALPTMLAAVILVRQRLA